MSYRNPQQYGIVEDMTAGTRAFQKGFGQVQDVIEKRKKEREEGKIREGVNEDKYLEGVKEATKNAEGLEIGSTNAVEEFAELYISDGFFKDKSVAERRKALNNIEKSAGLGGALETTLAEFQAGAIDFEHPATEKWLQKTKDLGDKAFSVDKETKQLMVNGMTWAAATAMLNKGKIAVQGDKNTDAATRKALQVDADKAVASATDKKGGPLTDDEKRNVVKQYVSAQTDILGNPNQHYVWKNQISNNSTFFPEDNPDKDDMDGLGADASKINNYQGSSYNGSEFTEEQRSKFLSKRQDALADYYTNIISGVVKDPEKETMTPYQKLRAAQEAEKIQLTRDGIIKENQDLSNVKGKIITDTSFFNTDGKTPKSDSQLSKNYAGVSIDGLPGMPAGANFTIRSVEKVIRRGGQGDGIDGQYLVKFNFGKMSGQTDLPSSKVFDLGDEDILRKLQINMAQTKQYGMYQDKLIKGFVDDNSQPGNKDVNYYLNQLNK